VVELKLPELGEKIETVEIAAVLVKVGDRVVKDQPVIEVETEKANLEVPAASDGTVAELLVKVGDKIEVGQTILRMETGESEGAVAEDSAEQPMVPDEQATIEVAAVPTEKSVIEFPTAPAGRKPEIGPTVPASPSVRRLARELGIEVGSVSGSGPGGRISRDDVKAFAKRLITTGASAGGAATMAAAAVPLPDFNQWGEIETEPLSSLRRATAKKMTAAWTAIPHVTQFDRADITQLESMRKRVNQRDETEGRKLTMTAIVIKMVASALKQFPDFNASLDLANDAIIRKKYVHIGVAVDTERGLLVPVIRDVDRKSLVRIAAELTELATRARDKKLGLDEMGGAGFTVSNLGGLGTTYFSPIVNWPQVAILGVGRAEHQAVFGDGEFQPRLMMPLSLSYDHRIIDGADAARFLRWLAEALEQPLLLLLDE
jgi:pyruvate dehydrogenase E2 component (dihydrolipoamide acetyltransferase)